MRLRVQEFELFWERNPVACNGENKESGSDNPISASRFSKGGWVMPSLPCPIVSDDAIYNAEDMEVIGSRIPQHPPCRTISRTRPSLSVDSSREGHPRRELGFPRQTASYEPYLACCSYELARAVSPAI
jgi:hypothetical protein